MQLRTAQQAQYRKPGAPTIRDIMRQNDLTNRGNQHNKNFINNNFNNHINEDEKFYPFPPPQQHNNQFDDIIPSYLKIPNQNINTQNIQHNKRNIFHYPPSHIQSISSISNDSQVYQRIPMIQRKNTPRKTRIFKNSVSPADHSFKSQEKYGKGIFINQNIGYMTSPPQSNPFQTLGNPNQLAVGYSNVNPHPDSTSKRFGQQTGYTPSFGEVSQFNSRNFPIVNQSKVVQYINNSPTVPIAAPNQFNPTNVENNIPNNAVISNSSNLYQIQKSSNIQNMSNKNKETISASGPIMRKIQSNPVPANTLIFKKQAPANQKKITSSEFSSNTLIKKLEEQSLDVQIQNELEKQRQKERLKQVERKRQRQKEMQRQRQRQRQREKERQKQREKEKERQRQKQRQRQRQKQREKERQKQRQRERERQIQREKQRQKKLKQEQRRQKQRQLIQLQKQFDMQQQKSHSSAYHTIKSVKKSPQSIKNSNMMIQNEFTQFFSIKEMSKKSESNFFHSVHNNINHFSNHGNKGSMVNKVVSFGQPNHNIQQNNVNTKAITNLPNTNTTIKQNSNIYSNSNVNSIKNEPSNQTNQNINNVTPSLHRSQQAKSINPTNVGQAGQQLQSNLQQQTSQTVYRSKANAYKNSLGSKTLPYQKQHKYQLGETVKDKPPVPVYQSQFYSKQNASKSKIIPKTGNNITSNDDNNPYQPYYSNPFSKYGSGNNFAGSKASKGSLNINNNINTMANNQNIKPDHNVNNSNPQSKENQNILDSSLTNKVNFDQFNTNTNTNTNANAITNMNINNPINNNPSNNINTSKGPSSSITNNQYNQLASNKNVTNINNPIPNQNSAENSKNNINNSSGDINKSKGNLNNSFNNLLQNIVNNAFPIDPNSHKVKLDDDPVINAILLNYKQYERREKEKEQQAKNMTQSKKTNINNNSINDNNSYMNYSNKNVNNINNAADTNSMRNISNNNLSNDRNIQSNNNNTNYNNYNNSANNTANNNLINNDKNTYQNANIQTKKPISNPKPSVPNSYADLYVPPTFGQPYNSLQPVLNKQKYQQLKPFDSFSNLQTQQIYQNRYYQPEQPSKYQFVPLSGQKANPPSGFAQGSRYLQGNGRGGYDNRSGYGVRGQEQLIQPAIPSPLSYPYALGLQPKQIEQLKQIPRKFEVIQKKIVKQDEKLQQINKKVSQTQLNLIRNQQNLLKQLNQRQKIIRKKQQQANANKQQIYKLQEQANNKKQQIMKYELQLQRSKRMEQLFRDNQRLYQQMLSNKNYQNNPINIGAYHSNNKQIIQGNTTKSFNNNTKDASLDFVYGGPMLFRYGEDNRSISMLQATKAQDYQDGDASIGELLSPFAINPKHF